DITFANLDLLMKVTVIRHNTMAMHSRMVMLLATELTKAIIQGAPELLIGTLECKTVEDVRSNVSEILDFVRKAAFCHDIGKIVLPNIINIQYRKATPTETEIIKMHPQIGSTIIDRVPALKVFYDIVMGHHKSYDGTAGYPEGYNNCNSPWRFITDIVHICDVLDAGTDTYGRLYKEPKTYEDIVEELQRGRCTEYNPEIVDFIVGNDRLKKTIRFVVTEGREVYLYFVSQIKNKDDELDKVLKGDMLHEG
ncbi:MAG: HD domain-containing protein, partial [Lachnospiraceae bacterium]|nr:HD domain-containing protein [Lachnospiraceae bacterium]